MRRLLVSLVLSASLTGCPSPEQTNDAEVGGDRTGCGDPGSHSRTRGLGQFELHRPLCFPLHDHGA